MKTLETKTVGIKTLERELNELLENYGRDEIGLGIDSDGIIAWYTEDCNTHDISENKICDASEDWKEELKKYTEEL